MKKAHVAKLVDILINLGHREYATVRRHESRITKNYVDRGIYMALSRDNRTVKNHNLVIYGDDLAQLQKENFDVYCQVIQLIQSERDIVTASKKETRPSCSKEKHALYMRRYRAKKAGHGTDIALEKYLDKQMRQQKLREAGLPRPKSLSHAQKMKEQLDAYIKAEEERHGTGNVSAHVSEDQ